MKNVQLYALLMLLSTGYVINGATASAKGTSSTTVHKNRDGGETARHTYKGGTSRSKPSSGLHSAQKGKTMKSEKSQPAQPAPVEPIAMTGSPKSELQNAKENNS